MKLLTWPQAEMHPLGVINLSLISANAESTHWAYLIQKEILRLRRASSFRTALYILHCTLRSSVLYHAVLLMYRAVLFVSSKGGERGPKSKLGPPAKIHEWELLI